MHLTKFSPVFASFQQKRLEKFVFVALGSAPAPPEPPGYAYDYYCADLCNPLSNNLRYALHFYLSDCSVPDFGNEWRRLLSFNVHITMSIL